MNQLADAVDEGAEREAGEVDDGLRLVRVSDAVDKGGEALQVMLKAVDLGERPPGGEEDVIPVDQSTTCW